MNYINSLFEVIGSLDSGLIQFWDIKSGKTLLTLCGHDGSVNSLKLINNYTLASASGDKTIIIWDISQAKLVRTLSSHTDEVTSVEYLTTGFLVRFLIRFIKYIIYNIIN